MGEFFVPSKSCPTSSSHEMYEFKSNNKSSSKNIGNTEKLNIEELEMKKARFDVYKFAQSGLTNTERQKSQFDLAIKLGAIPRKNKAKNYKELKEERKAQKKAEANRMTVMEKNVKPKVKRKDKKPVNKIYKKRKVGSAILKQYGQVRR